MKGLADKLLSRDRRITIVSEDLAIIVPIDLAESIMPQYDSQSVDTVIEDGSTISDHVISNPETLEINGFIGSLPPTVASAARGAASTFLIDKITGKINPIFGPASAIALAYSDPFLDLANERIKRAFADIVKLWRSKTLVDVKADFVFGDESFSSMIITNFTPQFNVEAGDGLIFKLSLKKIRMVEAGVVTINIKKTNGNKRLASKLGSEQNLGNQSLLDASDAASKRSVGILKNVSNKVSNMVFGP